MITTLLYSLVPVELLEIERQLDARLWVFYHPEQLDNGVTPGWYICLKDFNALPKKDLVIGKVFLVLHVFCFFQLL